MSVDVPSEYTVAGESLKKLYQSQYTSPADSLTCLWTSVYVIPKSGWQAWMSPNSEKST